MIKGLNSSKILGPDELNPRVLAELAAELSPEFAHLFQQSSKLNPEFAHLFQQSSKLSPEFAHLFQQSLDKGEIPKKHLWLASVLFIRRVTEFYQITIVQCP